MACTQILKVYFAIKVDHWNYATLFAPFSVVFIHYKQPHVLFVIFKDQTVGHPNNSGGKTLVSKVLADSSPQPLARAVKTQEPEGQLVHANLKLIEEVDIFKEDIKEKPSTVSAHILNSKQ